MAPARTESAFALYIVQKGACLRKRMERHYRKKAHAKKPGKEKSHERKSEAMEKLPDRV